MRSAESHYKNHPFCEYCETTDGVTRAYCVIKRSFGPKSTLKSLCERHYTMLKEIEGDIEECYIPRGK